MENKGNPIHDGGQPITRAEFQDLQCKTQQAIQELHEAISRLTIEPHNYKHQGLTRAEFQEFRRETKQAFQDLHAAICRLNKEPNKILDGNLSNKKSNEGTSRGHDGTKYCGNRAGLPEEEIVARLVKVYEKKDPVYAQNLKANFERRKRATEYMKSNYERRKSFMEYMESTRPFPWEQGHTNEDNFNEITRSYQHEDTFDEI